MVRREPAKLFIAQVLAVLCRRDSAVRRGSCSTAAVGCIKTPSPASRTDVLRSTACCDAACQTALHM